MFVARFSVIAKRTERFSLVRGLGVRMEEAILKLPTAPKLNLGSDFEVFPAKLTDKTSLTANGMSGTIYYDYTVVPHQKGNYTLPAINLEYYDTASGYYKTASSQPISFRVEQGASPATLL